MKVIDGAGQFKGSDSGGSRYEEQLRVGDFRMGTYSIPADGSDDQEPHELDELYVVRDGRATLTSDSGAVDVGPGSVVYVPAGESHEFTDITDDLSLLVFWFPSGR